MPEQDTHEEITTVPINPDGKTTSTSDPQIVKTQIANYFEAQVEDQKRKQPNRNG
jgi:hypothetical protein